LSFNTHLNLNNHLHFFGTFSVFAGRIFRVSGESEILSSFKVTVWYFIGFLESGERETHLIFHDSVLIFLFSVSWICSLSRILHSVSLTYFQIPMTCSILSSEIGASFIGCFFAFKLLLDRSAALFIPENENSSRSRFISSNNFNYKEIVKKRFRLQMQVKCLLLLKVLNMIL
jgi:hypothetical protein